MNRSNNWDRRSFTYELARSITAMGAVAVPEILNYLQANLANEEGAVAAMDILGTMRDIRPVDVLLRIINTKSNSVGVRSQAAKVLGGYVGTVIETALINVLSDTEDEDAVRSQAAESLGRMAAYSEQKIPKAVDPLIKALEELKQPESRGQAAWALAKLSHEEKVVDALIAFLRRETDKGAQRRALSALAETGSQKAAGVIKSFMEGPNKNLQDTAIEAAKDVVSTDLIEPLLTALNGIMEVKAHSSLYRILNSIKAQFSKPVDAKYTSLAYEALSNAYDQEQDQYSRSQILEALGALSLNAKQIDGLIAKLHGDENSFAIGEIIKHFQGPTAMDSLIQLDDRFGKNDYMRQAILGALRDCPLRPDIRLLKLLMNAEKNPKFNSSVYLIVFRLEEAVKSDPEVMVNILQQTLQDPDPDIKLYSLNILRRVIFDIRSAPGIGNIWRAVLNLADDPSPQTQLAALEAMNHFLGDPFASQSPSDCAPLHPGCGPLLFEMLNWQNSRARAL